MKKILRVIKNPMELYIYLASRNILKISDEKFLKMKYKMIFGKELSLEKPKTFSEKLQWLKLHDRKEVYTTMVDKYEVKKYVANIIGDEYIIPTLGVYDKFEEIDFDKLPNQFVMKCTHDSGGVLVCTDKQKFNINKARKKINKSLKENFYFRGREWPYKNVKPRIIIEKYMENKTGMGLDDYKLFCFNGEVKLLFIATDRLNAKEDTKFDFFDENFNHLPFTNGHPNAEITPKKPKQFEKMKKLAAILAKDIPHVRVDFYEINGKIYFGELTFYHWSGFVKFEPEKYDKILGNMIDITNI